MQLTPILELDEFNGWDVGDTSDNALIYELKHAWKDYFQKHVCPVNVSPQTLYPARDFCKEIGIPFRFFVRWCAQILGRFPQPWELNLKWLHNEVEYQWQSIKHIKVAQSKPSNLAKKILASHARK